jgi:oxygen-dependent protoporphyrinogen oxidase
MVQKGDDLHAVEADGIVCATTATVVSKIIPDLTKEQTDFFNTITYSSTVVAGYRMQHSKPLPTYAYAYPLAEGKPIVAMTVLSDPASVASVVKVYASGAMGKGLSEKSDEEIHTTLTAPIPLDVNKAFKVGEWRMQRWQEAIPEFDVGHLRKLRRFADGEIEDSNSTIVFAGDYIGGPFVEGAFTSGIRAAERLHERLSR